MYHQANLKIIRMKNALNALFTDIKTRDFPVDVIILFGSVARGQVNEYSDLDICIVHEQALTERQQRDIERYFNDMMQDEIDVDFTYCNSETLHNGPHVFAQIRKGGRILYERLS